MILHHFIVGPISTNCYLAACEETKEACIIDPDLRKDEEKRSALDEISRESMKLRYIINTHFHTDHTGGNGFLKRETDATLLVHEEDARWLATPWVVFGEYARKQGKPCCPSCGGENCTITVSKEEENAIVVCERCGFSFEFMASPQPDGLLKDGDILQVGTLKIVVIHTPGHSRGGISLFLEKEKVLFSGDTLFNRSIGRTDLPDSSFDDIMESLERLMTLPDETIVYPGHGERTTIGEEKRENPFLGQASQ